MAAELNVLIVEERMKIEDFVISKCGTYSELEKFIVAPPSVIDVVILDRLLNGQDSSGLVPKMKENMPDAKIIVLSAITTTSEKTTLLDQGVDDYLSKPFDIDELVARIRA